MAPAARASSAATASSRSSGKSCLVGFIFGFKFAPRRAHCLQRQVDVGARRAKVYDTGPEGELAAQHGIGKIRASATLHPVHDPLVEEVQFVCRLLTAGLIGSFELSAQTRRHIAKAANAELRRRQKLQVRRSLNAPGHIMRY